MSTHTLPDLLALAARLVDEAQSAGIAVQWADVDTRTGVTLLAEDKALTPALAVALGLLTREVDPYADTERLESFHGTRDGVTVRTQHTIADRAVVLDAATGAPLTGDLPVDAAQGIASSLDRATRVEVSR